MVAHLDRAHLQDVAGLLEPGQPWAKHDPDFARSRLVAEMDWLASDRLRHLHALLPEGFSATGRFGSSSCGIAISARTRGENSRFHYRRPAVFLRLWKEAVRPARARQANQHLGLLQRPN